MKLNLEQIKSIAMGAVRMTEEEDGIHFFRFTKQQVEAYRMRSKNAYERSFASAGIRLEFWTDSQNMTFEVDCSPASARKHIHHDIYCNGKLLVHLGSACIASGIFGGRYSLGEGLKKIQIFFPWSANSVLRNLTLDDGASLSPVSHSRKMLIFGDSITQGYDALYPSRSYASILTDYLDADACNKAIAGERFFPGLLGEPDDIEPDLITVAYGTNDWTKDTEEDLRQNIFGFYTKLSELYPRAKIFALTPIWRQNEYDDKMGYSFEHVSELIQAAADTLPNVTVISCYELVPKDPALFADAKLHPNDTGFAFYGERLSAKILRLIETN